MSIRNIPFRGFSRINNINSVWYQDGHPDRAFAEAGCRPTASNAGDASGATKNGPPRLWSGAGPHSALAMDPAKRPNGSPKPPFICVPSDLGRRCQDIRETRLGVINRRLSIPLSCRSPGCLLDEALLPCDSDASRGRGRSRRRAGGRNLQGGHQCYAVLYWRQS